MLMRTARGVGLTLAGLIALAIMVEFKPMFQALWASRKSRTPDGG